MNNRFTKLQRVLSGPALIKKRENLLYLLGRSFMHGYLLVQPLRRHAGVVFLGDGLEKVEGIHSDVLKNVGIYIPKKQTLQVFGEFTYAEVKYIKSKNKGLGIRVTVQREPADKVRAIKEPGEIALIRKSMQIVEQVFQRVRREIIKPGMTEIKLASFIRSRGLRFGAADVSFPPIVASGANAAVPHHVPGNKKLRAGESIILDFGFKYKEYCSDFTRTVFLRTAPKKMAEAYEQVEKAYNGSIDFIHAQREDGLPLRRSSSLTAGDVYQKSVEILAEKHLDTYFIHSLGHGTGLEIHELPNLSPKSKDVLEDGMVFSIEPGVYMKNVGGIRIEDLVYMQNGQVKKFIQVPTDLERNIIH